MPIIHHTPCHVREVVWSLAQTACDHCGEPAPRVWTTDRTAIDIDLDQPVLLLVTVSVHHCATCQHSFRAQPPFLRPEAIYTNRVVEKAVQAVWHDGMAMRRVPARLARDFWVQPDEGMVRRWVRAYRATLDFVTDYQPWVVREFSGILCVDEVYQGQLALLLAVDPAAPDGDRLVGYQLVHGSVDAASVEGFLTRLKEAGISPEQVITDGSALYPTVLTKVWPAVAHQLCLFHETRRVTKAVLEVISSVRKSLPNPPPSSGYRRSGRIRPSPPSDDPEDAATQRWQARYMERQHLLGEVHRLAKQGLSRRAIARQTGLHRQTVKAWLAHEPPTSELLDLPALPEPGSPRHPARPRARRSVLHSQVQALADEGLSYSAIARQLGLHRVTVSSWLHEEDEAQEPERGARPVSETTGAGEQAVRPEAAAPTAAPLAPWTSWEEVQAVREAVQKHRFLLLRRPEHLTAEQQAQVTELLASPLGSPLQVARDFLEEWYGVWGEQPGRRRSQEEAEARYLAWRLKPEYAALAPLRRVQERISQPRFEQLSQFLRDPRWEATNNGAERAGRAFRHRQAPHFNLRSEGTIEGALIVSACQRKAAALAPPLQALHTCQRGRKRGAADLRTVMA